MMRKRAVFRGIAQPETFATFPKRCRLGTCRIHSLWPPAVQRPARCPASWADDKPDFSAVSRQRTLDGSNVRASVIGPLDLNPARPIRWIYTRNLSGYTDHLPNCTVLRTPPHQQVWNLATVVKKDLHNPCR